MSDLGEMDAAWIGDNRYAVNAPGSYPVIADIETLTCSCNQSKGTCKHLEKAIVCAQTAPETTREITEGVSASEVFGLQQATSEGATTTQQTLEGDEADVDPLDTDVVADDAQAQLVVQVEDWVERLGEFDSAVDASVIECQWAELDGEPGIHIDWAPWFGDGYWDSSESDWIDEEAYQAVNEAIRQNMADRDEIVFTGDPHYHNFLPDGRVGDLV